MSNDTIETVAVLTKNQTAADVWNAGGEHYDRISRQIADAIEHCVDRVAPQYDDRILDVATGTGWAARRLAERGASVVGVDICSTALDTARRLDVGNRIDFQLGDAERLPCETASFDAVLSTFGVMFCGDPEAAARELARVCRPNGRLGLAVWDSQGGVYDMFRVIGRFKPSNGTQPPSPFAWASQDRLEELLGQWFELRVERAVSYYRVENAEIAWNDFSVAYGPLKTLLKKLDSPKQRELRDEFVRFHEQHQTSLGILVPRDYVIVRGHRNQVSL